MSQERWDHDGWEDNRQTRGRGRGRGRIKNPIERNTDNSSTFGGMYSDRYEGSMYSDSNHVDQNSEKKTCQEKGQKIKNRSHDKKQDVPLYVPRARRVQNTDSPHDLYLPPTPNKNESISMEDSKPEKVHKSTSLKVKKPRASIEVYVPRSKRLQRNHGAENDQPEQETSEITWEEEQHLYDTGAIQTAPNTGDLSENCMDQVSHSNENVTGQTSRSRSKQHKRKENSDTNVPDKEKSKHKHKHKKHRSKSKEKQKVITVSKEFENHGNEVVHDNISTLFDPSQDHYDQTEDNIIDRSNILQDNEFEMNDIGNCFEHNSRVQKSNTEYLTLDDLNEATSEVKQPSVSLICEENNEMSVPEQDINVENKLNYGASTEGRQDIIQTSKDNSKSNDKEELTDISGNNLEEETNTHCSEETYSPKLSNADQIFIAEEISCENSVPNSLILRNNTSQQLQGISEIHKNTCDQPVEISKETNSIENQSIPDSTDTRKHIDDCVQQSNEIKISSNLELISSNFEQEKISIDTKIVNPAENCEQKIECGSVDTGMDGVQQSEEIKICSNLEQISNLEQEKISNDTTILNPAEICEQKIECGSVDTEMDEEDDSWDKLFGEDGEALDPQLMEELSVAVGKVNVTKTQFDYYNYQPKEPDLNYEAYSHLIEIYDFAKELVTRDLVMAFTEFKDKGFEIKWVDDTHAIGVFSSTIAANSALTLLHPLIKVRPISEASRATKVKAKKGNEFLQPYKPRPETVASVARNMVAGALGLHTNVPKEKREEERRKLREARELKKASRKQKEQAWDGAYGRKCAMDDY